MSYSQKYSLVSFIKPVGTGTEFNMADWPLHITLADVFAIDLHNTDIETKLKELLSVQRPITTTADKVAPLGTAEVVLINNSKELTGLHNHMADLLEENSAVFNDPQFTRKGFLPHCTIQDVGKLHAGDKVIINTIALIDMFPKENWQQRKVISTFKLQG